VRKIIILLVISLIMVGLTSCNNEKVKKNMFIERVKTIEKNEWKMKTLGITYDQFNENIGDLFTENGKKYYFREKAEKNILSTGGEIFSMEDFEDISEEELKKYREIMSKNYGALDIEKIEYIIEISSEDYEGTLENEKRVYTKTTRIQYVTFQEEPIEGLIFKGYDFKEVDGEWKISRITENSIRKHGLSEEELNDIVSRMSFTPENNKEIKYVETMDLLSEPQ